MNLVVKVANIDRTNYIAWPSFQKQDVLNSQVDTCNFETKKYGAKTWRPNVGDEITVEDGITKIFAGVIVQVEENINALLLTYNVQCKDWTHYLDRSLVVERYENMTVNQIIAAINTNYLSGFTVANVNCAITVKSIAFNRLPVSKCLQLLAEQVNYSWYVDYNKDIHFFAKNSEVAPFNLSDTSGNYIFSSLRVKDDLSQLRNRVFVRGGEYKGTARSENFIGDGTKKTFSLANKFSGLPTVTLGGVTQTVGTDFLNQDASFNCLWNFNEKYVRFVNAPANAAAVVVTGTPLIPIIVQIQDEPSVKKYGAYEFSVIDKTIKSVEEARQYANSQLEAYANKIAEGSFETYNTGLRSGQTITIQSDIRTLNTSFLIQRVSLSMRTPTDGLWSVELATLRTIGIIDFLQGLLLNQDQQITIAENEVLEKSYAVTEAVQVTETITRLTPYTDNQTVQVAESIVKDPFGAGVSPDFVLAPYVPSGRETIWLPFKGNTLDISQNANNAVISGGVALTSDYLGKVNSAYNFNGVDGYMSVATSASLNLLKNVTAFFRIKTAQQGLNRDLILKYGGGGWLLIRLTTSGTIYLQIYDGVTSAFCHTDPAYPVNDNLWHHVIVTANCSNPTEIDIYIDGVIRDYFRTPAVLGSFINMPNFVIGLGALSGGYFSGSLSDIRIFDRVITSAEIAQLSNNPPLSFGNTDPKREGLLDISFRVY